MHQQRKTSSEEEKPSNAAPAPLDVETVAAEHDKLIREFRERGIAHVQRYGDDIVSMRLPISDEIAGLIDARLHRLGAAIETVQIKSRSFLELAPTLQQSAQRRVAAAEAALVEHGVPSGMIALDPIAGDEVSHRGVIARVFAWLLKPDDNEQAAVNKLRHVRQAAVDDLREIERQIREAHAAHQHADRGGVHLARAERSLGKATWAAYKDGVQLALPAGARDFGGEVDCGEPPNIELPGWATGGTAA
jgi:hypothetical protein